ncbi:hypothetical protein HGG72_14240 [Ochrobactrum pecoris]|uniref:Lipoprotein n=1 Tax=Brucella pecoris TaxID=867683 RepID=A0A5C5CEV9_9HYPH|nr:hypothetical protein [Brucella pecoris]MBB4095554.1 hypothetical protein [Brucella pecoris]NKW81222.1 hypothetical protein [Brucella pecoris]TNV09266.1 hypothetical protein FIB18_21145 [Brucella pecoris]
MKMDRIGAGAIGLLSLTLAGCTTSPQNYATTLSSQDPKWQSPQCEQIRAEVVNYEAGEKKVSDLAPGLLIGPYGLGIAMAIKENDEKRRKLFVREMHMRCSSQPLPKELENTQSDTNQSKPADTFR